MEDFRPYTSFDRYSVVKFGSKLLRFTDIAGFVLQMPLLYIAPSSFTQKFGDVPLELDR